MGIKNHHCHHQGKLTVQISGVLCLAICCYWPLFLASPLEGIQCLHRTDQCHFCRLVNLMCSCVEVHKRISHMSLPYFCSRTQHVLFILVGWFVRLEVSGYTAAVFWDAAFRICSKQHAASLRSSHFTFSPGLLFKSK